MKKVQDALIWGYLIKYTVYEGGVAQLLYYIWSIFLSRLWGGSTSMWWYDYDIGGGSLRTHVHFIIIAWPSYQNLNSSYRCISSVTPYSETTRKEQMLTLSLQYLDSSTTSEDSWTLPTTILNSVRCFIYCRQPVLMYLVQWRLNLWVRWN